MKRVVWNEMDEGARTALFSVSPESDTARAAATLPSVEPLST